MGLKKQVGIFLFLMFCLGCAAQPVALLNGFTREGVPVCLDERAGIPAIVRKFYAARDLTTEEGKIDYLIERVRNSDLVFLRNRVEYRGPGAASFLRWKLNRMENRYHINIKTAQDFVSQVASGSRMSGEPYAVILSDASRHNLQYVLQNELNVLESCLAQYAAETSTQHPQAVPSAPSST